MSYRGIIARSTGVTALVAICAACQADSADAAKQSVTSDATTSADGSVGAANSATAATGNAAGVHNTTASGHSDLSDPISIKVYKDANCGCCAKWIDHLAADGFKVEAIDLEPADLSLVKQKHGVKDELQSCHTGVVNGYVVEGHVPADVIRKMLNDKPSIAGLAVPGMPIGSPGMEGVNRERYDVLTFDRAGRTTVYAER